MAAYITCINGFPLNSVPQNMQRKVAEIAYQLGFREMGIHNCNADAENFENRMSRIDGIIAGISAGDIVVCQLPTWDGIVFEQALIERIKLYGGHIVIFIHDFQPLMTKSWIDKFDETVRLYNMAEVLIAPSYALKEFLLANGVRGDMKFVIQEIFDYPMDTQFLNRANLKKEIHFAGNPREIRFPDQEKDEVLFKIYCDGEYVGNNVKQMGWMDSSDLLLELSKGGFGLVWYYDEVWHQYLGYNCSSKISAYLTAGIPLIAPRGISNQYLIEGNHLGLIVDDLEEAVERVRSMTEMEYRSYVEHLSKFSVLLREGYFTKKFLIEAIHCVMRKDI